MNPREVIINLAKKAGIELGKDIVIHDDRFYNRVFSDGSLGLGETYMLGWWDAGSASLDEIIGKICQANLETELHNLSYYNKAKLGLSWLYHYLFPVKTVEDSKMVALQHYNLDRKLFQAMLGSPLMVYSCAYFRTDEDTLYQAQINKLDMVESKLKIKPGMRVLDIGCGWGDLAAYLGGNSLKESGVWVDGITISEEQYNYAKEKYGTDNITFYLKDYREFNPGYQYDAIVSVGMFEHVNSNNYREFMEIVSRLLKPGGLFLLHTIGGNKTKIVPNRWIQKYIFPNSCLPSLAQICTASEGIFVVEDVHNFGYHYSDTLMCWYQNFVNSIDMLNQTLEKPLTTEFCRMWVYYLLSCSGAFRTRNLQLYQVVLSKKPTTSYTRPF